MIKHLRALARWYERQKRGLPWRGDLSGDKLLYQVWVSEIMLQQTQVVTVVPFFKRFIRRLPTVQALARASEAEVLKLWSGLGYYSRARNLHRGARQLVQAQGGRPLFPKTREGWLEVPGVGEYTAGAILSIALNQPEPILDGNVERVLARFRRISRTRLYKERLWDLSRQAVQHAYRLKIAPSLFNQALMELGALICLPRNPRCKDCPIISGCQAQARGQTEKFPQPRPRAAVIPVQEIAHAVLDSEGRILLLQRKDGRWRKGLWDLPDEKEWLDLQHRLKLRKLGEFDFPYTVTRHRVTRTVLVWRARKNHFKKQESSALWISLQGEPGVALGAPIRKIIRKLSSDPRFELCRGAKREN